MNKLRRNNFNTRLTVENMSYLCSSYCDDFCFMISCTCDNLNPTQNEDTYSNKSQKRRCRMVAADWLMYTVNL